MRLCPRRSLPRPFLPLAREGVEHTPCVWLRGIPPRETLDDIPAPPTDLSPARWPSSPPAGALRGVTFFPVLGFGDASGGKFSSDPRLRRVGWAWTVIRWHQPLTLGREPAAGTAGTSLSSVPDGSPWEAAFSVAGPLCGTRQTINRGETTAFLDFLTSATGPCLFVTDSSYVLRGWARVREDSLLPSTNTDLWRLVRTAMRDRPSGIWD